MTSRNSGSKTKDYSFRNPTLQFVSYKLNLKKHQNEIELIKSSNLHAASK